MFPSLAALGGTLGLLGLREPELLGSEDIGNLNRGYQRHIDSCPVDYAALMRDPSSGHVDSPIATLVGDPPTATVALIGGGIANIIAAYELSRVGIRCTVYEATDATSAVACSAIARRPRPPRGARLGRFGSRAAG